MQVGEILSVKDVENNLKDGQGVVVKKEDRAINGRVKIYDIPKSLDNPVECYTLKENLTGAKNLYGERSVLLIKKGAKKGGCNKIDNNVYCRLCCRVVK